MTASYVLPLKRVLSTYVVKDQEISWSIFVHTKNVYFSG